MATTEYVVDFAPGPASVPTFTVPDDETGALERKVVEDTPPGGPVGAPVVATGPGTLVFSLEGSDAKYFNIDSDTGQITVGGDVETTTDIVEPGTDPELNYDEPDNHRMFSVTVKVEVMDGDATQKAEIDVNIEVTDVDETPVITTDGEAATTTVSYAEIDEDGEPNTAAVATYVGTDAEGDTITWDLRGVDAALFSIDGGVLEFRAAPDYENPMDGARAAIDMNGDDDENDPGEEEFFTDNTYTVVVRAIASRESDDTGPAETVDTIVNVTVTDVDENGEVVISWLQPEVGIEITANLTDPDGNVNVTGWQWAVSEVEADELDIDNDDHWGEAPGDGDDTATYEPDGADLTDVQTDNDDLVDEGKFLRVTAEYTDQNDVDKMAHAMSAYPVQARGLGAKNQSPDFDGAMVERSVAETAAVGDDVPGPVVATVVAPSSTDILTYGLRAVVTAGDDADVMPPGVTAPADADADAAVFDINKATGQITVAQELDFESRGPADETQDRDGKYVVVVEVFDPSANADADPTTIGYDFIVVVITAEDINEDPVLSGRPELTIEEIDSSDEDAADPDFVGNPPPIEPDPAVATVNVYGVVDEDRRAATNEWSLEGDDKDQLQLIGEGGRTLVFRNQPDYETPADADGDNVYKVTIVTLDGDGGRARVRRVHSRHEHR